LTSKKFPYKKHIDLKGFNTMKPILCGLGIITCIVFFFAYLLFKDRVLWEAVAALICLFFYAVSPCSLFLDRNAVPKSIAE
jgi:4-amino-4-deoxy-L-arabinose transferase-like glycosyltransferase